MFVAGAIDKRSRMYKLLTKHATVVECGAIEDQADAERWVKNRIAAAGVEIEPAAARRLAERAGPDVKRLRGEVDRLLLYAMGQPRITLDDVREVAGRRRLQDDWAMTNAIEAGQGADALRQLALMLDAGAPPEKILGQLGWLVRTKFPTDAGRCRPPSRACSGPTWRSSGRPATRACCSSGSSSSCVAKAGGTAGPDW